MPNTVLAWHFVSDTLRDGRPIPSDLEELRHTGNLILCESGLHASERIIDALRYAPGTTICRVLCRGFILRDTDKLVCESRTILWRVQGDALLRAFARKCALDVVHLWDAPEVVVEYLRTGEAGLAANAAAYAARAARAAGVAADAAGVVAGVAAAAAGAAAAGAGAYGAYAAARAAGVVADDVAGAGAYSAGDARAQQNIILEQMVLGSR